MVYDESALPELDGQQKDTGSAKSSYVDAALNGTLIAIGPFGWSPLLPLSAATQRDTKS